MSSKGHTCMLPQNILGSIKQKQDYCVIVFVKQRCLKMTMKWKCKKLLLLTCL
jgi:hypothetical protein